tara:strand:+ start:34955 stop:35332 length:378 start_codon:yes stop_codon:yes gene_type:complete
MKMINGWPGDVELPLAKGEKDKIISLLIEPFENETEARIFWQSYGNVLFIASVNDTVSSLLTLPEQLKEQINNSLTYPEFVEKVPSSNNGQCLILTLTIMNDEGGGNYILFLPGCPLIELIDKGF